MKILNYIETTDESLPDISYLINKINILAHIPEDRISVKTLTPVEAYSCRGNMHRLLKNILGIDYKYHIYHIVLNGYRSSIEYDGRQDIKIIEPNYLEKLHNYVMNDVKRITEDQ